MVNPRRFASAVGIVVVLGALVAAALWPRSGGGGNSIDLATDVAPTATTASTTTSFDALSTSTSTSRLTSTTARRATATTTKAKASRLTPATQGYCGTWSYSFPQAPNPNFPSGQISVFLGGSEALTGHPVIFEMTYSPKASGPASVNPEVRTGANGRQSFKARMSVGSSSQGESFVVHARAKDAPIVCSSHPFPAKYYPPEPPPPTYPPATYAPDPTTTTTTAPQT